MRASSHQSDRQILTSPGVKAGVSKERRTRKILVFVMTGAGFTARVGTEPYSSIEYSSIEYNGVEYSSVEYSGVKYRGVEYSGVTKDQRYNA